MLKTILSVIFVLICLALTVIVLLQEGKSEGLGNRIKLSLSRRKSTLGNKGAFRLKERNYDRRVIKRKKRSNAGPDQ